MYRIIKHKRIDGLEKEWKRLYEFNSKFFPYQKYEFNKIVHKYSLFSPKRYDLKPVFYEMFSECGETRMIIPLYIRKSGNINSAYIFGDFTPASNLDLIYPDNIEKDEFNYAFKSIVKDIGTTSFYLNKINQNSRTNKLISECFMGNFEIIKKPCVQIPVSREFDEYIKNLSRNTRQNLRTSYNRLERNKMKYSIEIFDNRRIDLRTLREIIKVYNKRAEGRSGCLFERKIKGISKLYFNPVTVSIKQLENNFSSILRINGKVAAFSAGLLQKGNRVVLPYLAMNEEFAKYSPGGLLIVESIRYLTYNSDIDFFDLSTGDEPYKFKYGGVSHTNFDYKFTIQG